MIDDLAGYGEAAQFEADLCVVGAGAAGIALARRFLGSPLRVILVESGGLEPDTETDRLKGGEADGVGADGLVLGRGRVFGGTTRLWAGQCIPLDPIDFERRDWVPHSGWPIDVTDLESYYLAAARVFGVPGENYDETLWERWGLTPPALDQAELVHSYTAWSPRPDLGRAFRREFERSENVRVLLHANVTGFDLGGTTGCLRGLTVRSLSGDQASIRVRACALCCGGVENARLLLAAGEPLARALGEAAQNVGRYFQDHPNTHCATLRTAAPRALQDPYSLFYRGKRRYLPKLKLAPAVQRSERVLNCAANLDFEFEDEGLNVLRTIYRDARQHRRPTASVADVGPAVRGLPGAAAAAYRRIALGRSSAAPAARIRLQIHSEQAPNADSRVQLSRERDALGMPRARVEWRVGELERRTLETMTETVGRQFSRMGLARTEADEWLRSPAEHWERFVGDSFHHVGTTRMSERPADGVVDPNCQLHGISGLFVSGGSVFPTSGFANPTLTIVALALRLADHLEQLHRR